MARARTAVREPVAAGQGIADVRERQEVRAAIERNAPPEFLRFVRHLDNGGSGYTVSSAAVLTIAHGLGRRHKGAWFTLREITAGTPSIEFLHADHASFDDSLRDTHVQIISDSASEATVKVAVF